MASQFSCRRFLTNIAFYSHVEKMARALICSAQQTTRFDKIRGMILAIRDTHVQWRSYKLDTIEPGFYSSKT